MKLFESEGWKSFRLNSLAVILGVVITFGGGRLITNCQKRQDAREIVGLFKSALSLFFSVHGKIRSAASAARWMTRSVPGSSPEAWCLPAD